MDSLELKVPEADLAEHLRKVLVMSHMDKEPEKDVDINPPKRPTTAES
jgi:hypothetical protein